jgi:hypothetical protein
MPILEKDLFSARTAWGNGLLGISKSFENEGIGMARKVASNMLDTLYGFDLGQVLFKPTLSSGSKTFRSTKEGALSYYIGQNSNYPNDVGFGVMPWREFNSNTSAIFIDDTVAMWMGSVSLIDRDGRVTKVEKSYGYKLDDYGNLRIMLHHSSLPYEIK